MSSLKQIDVLIGLGEIKSKSVDLIIVDPPYYKAINEKWDKQWKTEWEYIDWCKLWFDECVRILKDTGSFYCYGNFDILTKLKVILFDEKLQFRQNITLDKGLRSIAGRTSDKLRMFPTASEYLLFYVNQNEYQDRQLLIEPMIEIRNYLNEERLKANLTLDEMCRFLGLNDKGHGGVAYHWCSSKQPAMIPEKHYLKLQETGFFLENYVSLLEKMTIAKEKYCTERFSFNLPTGITDVWSFIPDKVRYGHPTQKPKEICERIVKASSNQDDTVVIPFGGSGSEIVICEELKREWFSFEIDEDYISIINKRLSELRQP